MAAASAVQQHVARKKVISRCHTPERPSLKESTCSATCAESIASYKGCQSIASTQTTSTQTKIYAEGRQPSRHSLGNFRGNVLSCISAQAAELLQH